METKKSGKQHNKRVYKCPFTDCDKKYKLFDQLQEHLDNVEHETEELIYKCVIDNCQNLVNCPKHYDKKNKRLLIYTKYQENAIENIRSNLYVLNVKDLWNERGIIVKILKTFITKNGMKAYDEDGYTYCRVISCNKRYSTVPGYFYHILFYKHSLTELISEYNRITGVEINENDLKTELADEKYCRGFRLCGIRQCTKNKKIFFKSIMFKNDFIKVDPKKDKFFQKKSNKNSDLSTLKSFEKDNKETSLIYNIIYKGEKIDKKNGSLSFGTTFINLSEFITAVYYDKLNGNLLVGCRSSKEPDILFNFNKSSSKIILLDLNLTILNTFNFSFGPPRKIRKACDRTFYILFKDGKIRHIDLEELNGQKEIIGDGYIDFEVLNNETLVCSDGFKLYIIENNCILHKSNYLPNAINSVVVRRFKHNEEQKFSFLSNRKANNKERKTTLTLKKDLYVINDDENKVLDELRKKLGTYNIICSTVEGGIYAFNDDLSDYFDIISSFSIKINYLEEVDLFVFTDYITDKTKVLSIEDEFITTHTIVEKISYCNTTINGAILSGGFDGIVYRAWYNYHRIKNQKIVKFYRSGYDLLVLDHEDEFDVLQTREEFDYSTLIVGIVEIENFIYVFLSSGVILKKLLKG